MFEAAGLLDQAVHELRTARSRGFFTSVFPTAAELDLRDCSSSVAKCAIRLFLSDLSGSSQNIPRDVLISTGQGTKSNSLGLRSLDLPSFLAKIDGPPSMEVPNKPGRFLISGKVLSLWAKTLSARQWHKTEIAMRIESKVERRAITRRAQQPTLPTPKP